MSASSPSPSEKFASDLAQEITGTKPLGAIRFPTGSRHYVYDVNFASRRSLVMRIGDQSAHKEMEGAVLLSKLLRPSGVPLPELIAHNTKADLPWMALQRFSGTDLGAVYAKLSQEQREVIAGNVANAQIRVASTRSAGRYGYAAIPEDAPHNTWADVLTAHFERSKRRIRSAALFDITIDNQLEKLIVSNQPKLDQIKATPFLHDTTVKNVIIDSRGTFSGIVDVDDLCFGDPRYPVALTLAALLVASHPTDYISVWMSHIDQPNDKIFRLYVALFLFDFMSEHGQKFNGNQSRSTPEARALLLQLLQEQLSSI